MSRTPLPQKTLTPSPVSVRICEMRAESIPGFVLDLPERGDLLVHAHDQVHASSGRAGSARRAAGRRLCRSACNSRTGRCRRSRWPGGSAASRTTAISSRPATRAGASKTAPEPQKSALHPAAPAPAAQPQPAPPGRALPSVRSRKRGPYSVKIRGPVSGDDHSFVGFGIVAGSRSRLRR